MRDVVECAPDPEGGLPIVTRVVEQGDWDEPAPPPRLPNTVAELQQFVADAVRKALPERRAPKRKRPRPKRSRPTKKG